MTRAGGPRRLFVSDLHLTAPDDAAFRTLAWLLDEAATQADEVYLLGDVCEVWVGDDDDAPLARALVDLLRRSAARMAVYVMHGNRDFLLGADFARAAGVTLLPDPYHVEGGVLLSHGDLFCTDDHEYQAARRELRSPDWQEGVLARPLAERRALADAMRAQSLATNANKAENIMDVTPAAVDAAVRRYGARTVVHGHTHRPGIHRHSWGRRYVLGAWERCGWRLLQLGDTFSLACLPLRRE